MKLIDYLQDGADAQSRAVLMLMQGYSPNDVKEIENGFIHKAFINVGRWENCREQGYILSMGSRVNKEQLNIIFFQHRNSDRIHAVKWLQNSLNIDTAKMGDIYKDKYDTSFSVEAGNISEMCKWICQEFDFFWEESFEPSHKFKFDI